MNTNSVWFPKCLFESFNTVLVVSFYFTYRDGCMKLPVVAKKTKLELSTLSAPVRVCVCVCVCGILLLLLHVPLFSLWLGFWTPWGHDHVHLLPSCFWVSLGMWLLDMHSSSAGCQSCAGLVHTLLSYRCAVWSSLIAQGYPVPALG